MADDVPELVGALVRTRDGRLGVIVSHDPEDKLLELKVQFLDDMEPSSDWLSAVDVFAQDDSAQLPQSGVQPSSEEVGDLFDIFEDEGIGAKHGLTEIEGGIGVDSCASDNVTARKHLKGMGYRIKPPAGSKRGQRWGSASGHTIDNEGEVSYKFMTESGTVSRGTTQIGEVRRPLAAVSRITKAGNMVIFSEGDDWIIDRRDEVADAILKLVRQATKKVKM